MNIPAILACDGYKTSHRKQYNPSTELVYSTWVPRKSRLRGVDKVVFFGLQAFIKDYLVDSFNNTFFNRPKEVVIQEFKRVMERYSGDTDTEHWEALHDLGYLPLRIDALEEGTLCPIRVPMFTIQNTKPEFYWLTNFVETIMSTEIWKPMTSATIALEYRKILEKWADKTCDDNTFVDYQAHDFSLRGMAGLDAGLSSGAGHLLSFKGSDTIPAILWLEKYYNADITKEVIANGIAGSEHSVQETNILNAGIDNQLEGEYQNLKYFLTELYPTGIFSYVADTYNLWYCVTKALPRLKDEILSRDGKLVVRPDCYDEATQILTDNGWKYFKDLVQGVDKVAQYHRDGSIDFVIPIKYYSQHYTGNMYKFNNINNNIDLLVTPNHRMIVRNQDGDIDVRYAEDIKYKYNEYNVCAGLKQGSINHITPMDRLNIAIQADGRVRYRENSTKFIVDFQLAKQRKIDRLINICKLAGVQYKLIKNSRMFNEKNSKWSNQSTVYVYLENKPSKDFSSWINLKDKSYEWCREFIDEVVNWDGHRRTDTRFKYDTTNPKNAIIVQQIAVLAGYRTKYTQYTDNRSDKYKDIHTINILTNKDSISGRSIIKQRVDYDGNIYCVQVPTGMLVVRRNNQVAICGNSGDPCDIICGLNTSDKDLSMGNQYSNEINKGVIELLWDIFGGTINSKGYKVLDKHIGAIYGDAITLERADEICRRLEQKGFASSNVNLGVGSYTYNMNTRDTFGFALKTTYAKVDGKELMLFKDPITDDGTKKSNKGMVVVAKELETDKLICLDCLNQKDKDFYKDVDLLKPVFKDGVLLRDDSLSDIRQRVLSQVNTKVLSPLT